MTITDFAEYKTMLAQPAERRCISFPTFVATTGDRFSRWRSGTLPGAIPSTAEVPASTVQGALGQINGTNPKYLLAVAASILNLPTADNPVTSWFCDRLSHQGGLDATLTTAQTTNLPTAALTRYTGGIGVYAALEIYTQIGATATTVTASYTNDTGTAGRTSQAVPIGGTGDREVSRLILLPLQQGDRGVRAIASVTLAATTGTVGDFGVTLFRPLLMVPPLLYRRDVVMDAFLQGACQLDPVLNDACLFQIALVLTGPTGAGFHANVAIAEEP